MRFDLTSTDPGMVEWFLKQTAANESAFVIRFISYTATLEWNGEPHRIACPTLMIYPGGETVGSAHSYDSMRNNVADVRMIEYPHMPHNIADMMPDRCVADIIAFHRDTFAYPRN